jgi:hypothetical protein
VHGRAREAVSASATIARNNRKIRSMKLTSEIEPINRIVQFSIIKESFVSHVSKYAAHFLSELVASQPSAPPVVA